MDGWGQGKLGASPLLKLVAVLVRLEGWTRKVRAWSGGGALCVGRRGVWDGPGEPAACAFSRHADTDVASMLAIRCGVVRACKHVGEE